MQDLEGMKSAPDTRAITSLVRLYDVVGGNFAIAINKYTLYRLKYMKYNYPRLSLLGENTCNSTVRIKYFLIHIMKCNTYILNMRKYYLY